MCHVDLHVSKDLLTCQGQLLEEETLREGAHYRTYKSWQALKDRCNRAKCINYNKYGGAGVTYDPSWEKYDQFLADMGERPEGMTLDRIDNSKGYSKENCRWATYEQQLANRSCSMNITYNGITQSASMWAKSLGLAKGAVWNWIKLLGWDVERAVTTGKVG